MTFKYSGELTKAIPVPTMGLLLQDAILASLVSEQSRRMGLLFEAHGIAKGNWEVLCYALAKTHVPGLRLSATKPGKKTKWDVLLRAELVLAVEQTGIGSITKAIAHLATIEPWKSHVTYTRGADTLKDEYNRADKRWVEVMRDAIAYREQSAKS